MESKSQSLKFVKVELLDMFVLRRILALAGASMLKTLLLINELTCLLGKLI